MTENKPSELLFVRTILPHCKRIGPLWLKNLSNLRKKYREHSSQNHKTPDILLKFDNKSARQFNEEVNIVVNLLRKLYREIQPQYIMNLIKCWLNFPEIKTDNSCIITKGDCRGRMKRIDGGKGADKIWRLDTLIGIMFHGLPLTSADTNMIYHTCQHDLCVRPQHLRFKADSISLVLVLKALQQKGYAVKLDSDNKDRFDEFVNIAGPFGILELESLRHEMVNATQISSYKLACSPDDVLILDQNPSLKNYYLKSAPTNGVTDNKSQSNNDEIRKRLLVKLSEDGKYDYPDFKLIDEERVKNEKITPSFQFSHTDSTSKMPHKKRTSDQNLDSECSLSTKSQKLSSKSSSDELVVADDVEDKELIEIMETKSSGTKLKTESRKNCLFPNIYDSPFKVNSENLIRVNTRSESSSTLEYFDKKTSSQFSVCCFSQLKTENDSRLDENRSNDFLDMLHSMRHQYNNGSSLKMTPNIFSPVSEIDES